MLETGIAYRVAELLPHGPGFMLLDALCDYGDEHARCAVGIGAQTRFFMPGRGVPAWVGIEYMAQTIGVYAGITRVQRGLPIEIGLLLGTRRYEVDRDWFAPGASLDVRADLLVRDGGGVAVFRCTLGDASGLIASAEIKAFQPDRIDQHLEQMRGGK